MKRVCSVENCDRPTRSARAEWCKMHYHRWYRHGSVQKVATGSGITASHGRRYRSLHLPRHPLAGESGKVYEHRAVLYDKIGPGSHACHWCLATVVWSLVRARDELQVDHLNNVGDDNRPSNLVPSCRRCNAGRAVQARSDALRAAGWWSSHDTIASLRPGRKQAVGQRRSTQLA